MADYGYSLDIMSCPGSGVLDPPILRGSSSWSDHYEVDFVYLAVLGDPKMVNLSVATWFDSPPSAPALMYDADPEHVLFADANYELADWIHQLPKPVGIMACTDQLGFWLLDACDRAGVDVPVIGVENDESLCEMANPPMSSVWFDAERIGYQAARLLDRMMRGQSPPPPETLYPPGGIVTRRSSDIIAVDDEMVGRALHFIRDHADRNLRVGEVAEAVFVSRSVLERRMRQTIGRSPKAEIIRVRLQLVQDYLLSSSLTLTEIAERTVFHHPQYLAELFKKKLGQTPGQFRGNYRKAE
jgi:LacI family transcriptional regulator